jgi:hypothetical protein
MVRVRLRAAFGCARPGSLLAVLSLAIALSGCSPIESWRSMTGASKNDPDPETAPFTGNLAKAEAGDYPNLASVPPPPTRASSTAERKKLMERLIAEGEAARANPPPTPAGPIVAPPMPEPPAFPIPRKAPLASLPPVSEPKTAAEEVADASDGMRADPAKPSGRNRPESGRRKQGEPPEPSPRDSSVASPELASLPDPEAVRPPPPLPDVPPRLAPATVASIEPPPAAVAAGTPQPAPAAPEAAMAPMPPPPSLPPPAPDKPPPKRPPAATTLASIDLPGGGATPGAGDRELIERIAGLYKQRSDTLRVLAYAGAPPTGADPLDSYRAALDRAQTVAGLLGKAGIPANRIQTEATPAGSDSGRVEIQLLP